MNGKQRCHERRGPRGARHPSKRQEKQDGAERLEKNAGQEMHPRPLSPHRRVEHVREPGQRMPAKLRGRQRPTDVPLQDVRVLVDELPVIEIEKGM